MTVRRVCLVRAVNVGGTGRLPMAQWRELAAALGASDVSTYINSGNLLCSLPDDADVESFDRALERAVEHRFGFFREVVSRLPGELELALTQFPFEVVEAKFAYVVFLSGEPAAADLEAARGIPTGDDVWEVRGRELFVRYAEGAGRSNPGMTKVGKVLGVPGTARNLLTVRKLISLAG